MGKKQRQANDILGDIVLPTQLAAVSLQNSDPYIVVTLAFIYGVTTVFRKWQTERMQEINEKVGYSTLNELIERDNNSRDTLHRILTQIMDEQSHKKREFFYHYIKNLHKNIHPEYDYHSKIITVINLISFEEIQILYELDENYNAAMEVVKQKEQLQPDPNWYVKRGANISELMELDVFKKYSDFELENTLTKLANNYGLIIARYGRFDGTFFGPLEEFGKVFIDYIRKN